jgi:hypothetical protein
MPEPLAQIYFTTESEHRSFTRSTRGLLPTSAILASCQCFARRVNVMAMANVVVRRFKNPLSIKGPSTVHGVVFAFLFWALQKNTQDPA